MTALELIVASFLALSPYHAPVCTPADPTGHLWVYRTLKPPCPLGLPSSEEAWQQLQCVRRVEL